MAALLDKVQPTHGIDTQGRIPLRASRSQAQHQAVYQQGSAPLARSTSSQTSAPLSSATTAGLEEGDLPQTNPPGTALNRFKRLTGKLYPYTYRPQSGQTQARRNGWQERLYWFLSGGWFAVISKFVTLLVILYTIAFFAALGVISAYNTVNYGPTHTAYTTAVLNGEPATIQTSNQGGTIYVMITKQGGSSQTYTGPNLNLTPDSWNRDVNSVVATAEVNPGQNTITIHLLGMISYFRLPLFSRPAASFSLVPDGQSGYKVVQP